MEGDTGVLEGRFDSSSSIETVGWGKADVDREMGM